MLGLYWKNYFFQGQPFFEINTDTNTNIKLEFMIFKLFWSFFKRFFIWILIFF